MASAMTWTCTSCTYENQLKSQYCSMCNEERSFKDSDPMKRRQKRTKKEDEEEIGPEVTVMDRLSSFSRSLFRLKSSHWSCPGCTYKNNEADTQCAVCGHDKPIDVKQSKDDRQSNDTNTGSITSSISNGISSGFKKLKKLFEPEPEVTVTGWTCRKCTFVNHPDLLECEQCGSTGRRHPLSLDHILPTDDGEVLFGDPAVLRELINKLENSPLNEYSLEETDKWVCPACTYHNKGGERCGVCERRRTIVTPLSLSTDVPNKLDLVRQISSDQSQSVKEIEELMEDYARRVEKSIVAQQKKLKEPFIDPDFPHSPRSLYINPKIPISRWDVISKWSRPADIRLDRRHGTWCVFRDPKPDDIAQGMLGDCWFLSALAVIAEVPELLQKILITKEFCPQGVYLVKLCRDGLWQTILVDDYFPVTADFWSNQLVFSKARRGQLWVPLIEKAMAKMYGSYESLDGGTIISGLSVLTGYPCDVIHLRAHHADEEVEQELVWAKLLSFKESKFPMAASSSPVDPTESIDTELGIQPFHAYSILDIKQIGTESVVVLRDPWGHTKPGREWRESEPGTFMIGSNHLFKYFSHVDVCYYHPDWHSIRVKGQFPRHAPSHLEVLTFQTFEPTEVKICLYQPSYRGCREESYKKVDILLLLVRYDDRGGSLDKLEGSLPFPSECITTSKHNMTSVVTCSAILNPGRYSVIPLSFKNWHATLSHESPVPYVIGLFSAKVIEWVERAPTKPGYLSESLFLLARKEGTLRSFNHHLKLYDVHISRSLWFVVIENHDKFYHYRISIDFTGTINLKLSRNGLQIDDYIPPQHRLDYQL
ncbi:PREDICTED: calpain-15-like [Amphimedon queenslandica]|uniref:Calpain catalytic domain-containing protein n=2 Tax=Amphimedon queenslandica TaxID=400682 RepID=A0AAN0JBQ7_AMPQE|nr:PREDICTED: calpain-15-like [Amphimedon queenslandica]|eukprot:XP_019854429.1 PREDICTED: calpain-15-like [Amphimedon queenslandica]